MDKLKKALSGQEDEEEGIVTQPLLSQIQDATTLSWSTRIKGFIICFVLGIVCSVLGSALFFIPNSGLTLFAIFYTLGSIVALLSTCFLMGPVKQCKRMFDPTRLIATLLVLVFITLTLMAALWWKIGGLVLLFCVLQFLAMAWYSISFIPFARDAIKKCFTSCID